MKHSRIGASSASRWLGCPGSVRLCEHAPPGVTSKYAAEGTLAHTVAELYLRGDEEKLDSLRAGTVHAADMFVHGKAYKKFVDACCRSGKLLVEHSFDLARYDDRAFGTCDACIVDDCTLTVVDYKYGAGVAVEARDNPQLRFYALGALFSLTDEQQADIQSISIAVFQPRAPHDMGPIRSETLTKAELMRWGDEVLHPGMLRTRDPDAPCITGSWCRWCPAITLCPHQGKLPIKVSAAVDFRDPITSLPTPKHLTPEQLGIALQARSNIEAWFEQVETLARAELSRGAPIPGWKLVQGRKTKSWKNESDAEQLLSVIYGDQAHVTKLVSPAAAIKMGFVVPYLVEETIGNPSLVEASNDKPSLQPSAITDFKGETDGR